MSVNSTGYAIEEGVIASHECDALVQALAATTTGAGRAGARHLMQHPAVAGLAHDDRLLRIARSVLAGKAVPFRATLFAKSDKANWLVVWHQDTALPMASRLDSLEWGPWSIKKGILYAHAPAWALRRVVALRLHLDASTRLNGPLRIIPKSHTSGVLTDEEVFALAGGSSSVDCLVRRGGILAMRPLVIHASSKSMSKAPRRVLHIEYADALDFGGRVRLAMA